MIVLSCRDLSRVFSTPAGDVEALKSATFDVAAGEMSAIMGPSGSGKSTLLQLLGLMDQPTQGNYQLLGRTVDGMSEKARSQLRATSLGFVFQSFHLVGHRSAAENVALPLAYQRINRRQRRRQAEQALTEVGLMHRLDAYPATLSGGEKQRVAIARALVHGPAAVLCDEPTGALDSANAEHVVGLLRAATQRGVAVVVVTHDAAVAAEADTVYAIKDGVLRATTSSEAAP